MIEVSHTQLVIFVGIGLLIIAAFAVSIAVSLWAIGWDIYDNITGNWKRIANTRENMAKSNCELAPRAQRGSQIRGHV